MISTGASGAAASRRGGAGAEMCKARIGSIWLLMWVTAGGLSARTRPSGGWKCAAGRGGDAALVTQPARRSEGGPPPQEVGLGADGEGEDVLAGASAQAIAHQVDAGPAAGLVSADRRAGHAARDQGLGQVAELCGEVVV